MKKTSLANHRGEVDPLENDQPKKKRKIVQKEPETFDKEDFIQQNALGPACDLWMGKGNPKPFRIIFAGKSTMGKTTMAVDIIMKHILPKVTRVFAACPTFWQQPALKRLRGVNGAFNKRKVFTRVDDEVFEYIFSVLDRNPAPTLLFVDDAAAEASTNKGNKGAFSRLCLASPHLQLTIVGCFQRLSSASPALRDNTEGLVQFIPSKIHDVDTIEEEFNPFPAARKSTEIVREALQKGWDTSRFTFIWRQNFTGAIFYYSGFDSVLKFNKD